MCGSALLTRHNGHVYESTDRYAKTVHEASQLPPEENF